MPDLEERVDRIVERLLRGGRVKVGGPEVTEKEAIVAAARLVGSREAHPRMSPAFRRRLATMVRGEETPVTRRAALMGAAGLAVGAVGAAVAGRLGGEPTAAPPPPGPAAGIVRPIPGWTRVAAFATLPEDGPVKVVAGTVTAYLFRTGEHVRAVSAICSDLPCALDWRGDSDSLYCPCHRALFTAQGKSLSDIYPVPPLATYEVKVEGGDVYLKAP